MKPRNKIPFKAESHAGVDCMNYYQILGVPSEASFEEIKVAYRHLLLKSHPDKTGREKQYDGLLEIRMAWETLSDAVKRKEYDESLILENTVDMAAFYESVPFEEWTLENGEFHYECRCGGIFSITANHEDVLVPCTNCSLKIHFTHT